MNWLDLLRDPLLRSVTLVFWLLPCAIQDRRTRHVSNWLTVPLFLLAWPATLLTDNLLLTLAVFIGVVVAWRWGGGMGSADGKIAVGLAGFLPVALGVAVVIQALQFPVMRLRGARDDHLPGELGFYAGAVTTTLLLAG